jgi:hypothetical protein
VLTGATACGAPITRERKPQSYQLSWRAARRRGCPQPSTGQPPISRAALERPYREVPFRVVFEKVLWRKVLTVSIVKRRPESAESKSITVTDHTVALMTMLDAPAARSLGDRARSEAARPTSQAGTCSPTRSNAPRRRGASAASTNVCHVPERKALRGRFGTLSTSPARLAHKTSASGHKGGMELLCDYFFADTEEDAPSTID